MVENMFEKPLPDVLESTAKAVQELAVQGDSKMVEEFIRFSMTSSVFQIRDICISQIISELGLSEQSQAIIDKIHNAIPCSDIHTDLLNSTSKE